MEKFNLSYLKTLAPSESKAYVTKFFIPLSSGDHAMLKNDSYEIITDKIVKTTYFNRMSKELNNYYFKELDGVKSIEYKLNKDTFYDDVINLCPKMKHKYKSYGSFTDSVKAKVNTYLDYVKEVICSKNEASYTFVIKWIANMIKGNKNNSCIYLKGNQGIGKSFLTEVLAEYVIGLKLCLETGSNPLKSHFNSVLAGKLLVQFEELENMSISEWNGVSSVLKRIITSKRLLLEAKNQNSYEAENINNYILMSNNDAIKDDDGRRYFIADVATHRQNDEEYWINLRKTVLNDEAGEALYCYFMEIETTDFNPQAFPMTNSKKDSITKRLDSVYSFLKDTFILKHDSVQHSVQDLYDQYVSYCLANNRKSYHKQDFNAKLSHLQIKYFKSNGINKYKVSYDYLFDVATKNHWIHELDEFDEVEPIKQIETIVNVKNPIVLSIKEDTNPIIEDLEADLLSLSDVSIDSFQNISSLDEVKALEKHLKLCRKNKIKLV